MGKPAARMGDTTAHGGSIILGNPTILIGKMPASTLGDMHVCPMCTGPVPHVGGPILLGSMGVLIGKKPAARISDMAVCVGPPSMPVMGCMTVLIGEVGSGSQAGSAGAAASAQAAKAKGPKAIEAYPLGQPPETTESHEILVEFKDSAGKSLSGIFYTIKDPDSKDIVGCSTVEGTATHGGYAKKGNYELTLPSLSQAKWKKPKLKMGEEADFSIEAEVPDTIKTASIIITESRGALRRALGNFELPIKGKKIAGKWMPDYTELESHQKPESENSPPSQVNNPPEYTFTCVAGGLVVVSDSLKIADVLNIELLDGEGKGIANADYEIALPGGEIRTGKLDGSGKAQFEDLEPGGAEVRFPNHLGKEKTPEKKPNAGEANAASAGGTGTDREIILDEIAISSGTAAKGGQEQKKEISGKGLKFPLKNRPEESYKKDSRMYGCKRPNGKRKDRLHAGCDLYAKVGDEVFSVADGVVRNVSPFYAGTWEITVDHGHFMIRYGEVNQEVEPGIKIGAKVKKGAVLGYVGTLEGLNKSMLHFELYGTSAIGALTDTNKPPFYRRADLMDPTTFLDELSL